MMKTKRWNESSRAQKRQCGWSAIDIALGAEIICLEWDASNSGVVVTYLKYVLWIVYK